MDFVDNEKFATKPFYPYAASSISMMAMQGGFPGVYLSPMNFEASYLAQKNQETPVRSEEITSALH